MATMKEREEEMNSWLQRRVQKIRDYIPTPSTAAVAADAELVALRKEYDYLLKRYPRIRSVGWTHPLIQETAARIQRLEHEQRLRQFRQESTDAHHQ